MPKRTKGKNSYRYAYQGQEKDPETGKEAFQLRLWDGRIGRWLTTDPYGQFHSPYLGMGNNPISQIDPDGGMSGPPDEDNCCDGFDMKHPGVDLGTFKGVKGNTGYTPTFRDWQILDLLRQQNANVYASIKNRYASGDFIQLGGGKWGDFTNQFNQGYGAKESELSKLVAGAIGIPLIGSNPVVHAAIGGMSLNSGRSMVISSTSNFLGQYSTNGYSFSNVDYFDVAMSGLFKGRGSIFFQSAINIRGNGDYGFNSSIVKDLAFKSMTFSINKYGGSLQGLSGNAATEFFGDLTFRTVVAHGAMGVSSTFFSK